MKSGKVCILLAGLFLASPIVLAAQDSAKVRVLALENAWNEAQSHRDEKALASLIASTFAYTDAQGNFMDKAQFLAGVREEPATQIVNEGMKAESYGEMVVVVTGAYREQGTEKGKPYSERGRFTDTWIQQNGQWLCVASQETLIAK